jgi:hypothetical protein
VSFWLFCKEKKDERMAAKMIGINSLWTAQYTA